MSLLLLSLNEEQLPIEQIAEIKRILPKGMSFVLSGEADTIKRLSPEIEIFAGWFDPSWLVDMPRLRWLQTWGAGVNWLLRYPEFRKAPFILTNAVGVHPIQISEHVFALLLALGRNLPNAFAAQKTGVWAQVKHSTEPLDTPFAFSSGQLFELANKTMLILGVGAIGERIAKLAKAFDMHVTGMRRNPEDKSPFVDLMIGPDGLAEVLGSADFVVNVLPFTDATKHLLGQREFKMMKSSAYLINVGRGATINESALVEALRSGDIAGAGLDVFEIEPLPKDSSLWVMPNVLITSHYGGATPHYHERATNIFINNLQRYKRGQPLRNVVDKQLGY